MVSSTIMAASAINRRGTVEPPAVKMERSRWRWPAFLRAHQCNSMNRGAMPSAIHHVQLSSSAGAGPVTG
jgi:hypothetical protein